MRPRTAVLILFLLLLAANSSAGPLSYAACQAACNTAWVACVAARGGVAGVATLGRGVPAAVRACGSAQGRCKATCAVAMLAPTP